MERLFCMIYDDGTESQFNYDNKKVIISINMRNFYYDVVDVQSDSYGDTLYLVKDSTEDEVITDAIEVNIDEDNTSSDVSGDNNDMNNLIDPHGMFTYTDEEMRIMDEENIRNLNRQLDMYCINSSIDTDSVYDNISHITFRDNMKASNINELFKLHTGKVNYHYGAGSGKVFASKLFSYHDELWNEVTIAYLDGTTRTMRRMQQTPLHKYCVSNMLEIIGYFEEARYRYVILSHPLNILRANDTITLIDKDSMTETFRTSAVKIYSKYIEFTASSENDDRNISLKFVKSDDKNSFPTLLITDEDIRYRYKLMMLDYE